MNEVELGFLSEIRKQPDADEPRLIYADWLEEQGDSRAEIIRLEVQFANLEPANCGLRQSAQAISQYQTYREQLEQLNELLQDDSRSWSAAVSYPYDLILCSYGSMKLNAVRIAKDLTRGSLRMCKELVESAPAVISTQLDLVKVFDSLERFWYCSIHGEEGSPSLVVQRSGLMRIDPKYAQLAQVAKLFPLEDRYADELKTRKNDSE